MFRYIETDKIKMGEKGSKRRKRTVLWIIALSVFLCTNPVFSANELDAVVANCEKALSEAGIGISWLNYDYRYAGINISARQEEGLYSIQLLDEILPDRYAEDGSAYADLNGNILFPGEFSGFRGFSEGLAPAIKLYNKGREDEFYRVGFVDNTGKLVIPADYWHAEGFSEGLAPVQRPGENFSDSWGYVDKDGNMAIPFSYLSADVFHNGAAAVSIYTDQQRAQGLPVSMGLIDKSGSWILEPVYDGVYYAGEGLFSVKLGPGLHGAYDSSGNMVFSCSTEEAIYFERGVTAASRNGKYGLIDRQGNQLLPCEYDQLLTYSNEEFIRVAKGTPATRYDWGIADYTGKLIVPLQYKTVGSLGKNLIALEDQQEKWGVLNAKGEIVLPFEYLSVHVFENDVICVYEKRSDGTDSMKMLDSSGQPLFPQEFNGVVGFSEGIWIMEDKNGCYGGLDEKGNVVIPFVFSHLTRVDNGKALGGIRGTSANEDLFWAGKAGIITLPGALGNAAGNAEENTGTKNIRAFYNGTEISFDQDPLIEDGRTLVPMRAIFEAAQAEIEWDPEAMLVTGKKVNSDGSVRTVQLTIGESTAFVDGKAVALDVPARLSAGRTIVPLRFVTENLSDTAKVEWNQEEKLITITDEDFHTTYDK